MASSEIMFRNYTNCHPLLVSHLRRTGKKYIYREPTATISNRQIFSKRRRFDSKIFLRPTTAMGTAEIRKPRFLCLHGFRTSGEILRKQVSKWPESVLQKVDLVFPDGQFPARGKSDVDGIFDPPYYEWFQFNKEFTEYTNFTECLDYIEECMIKHAPIDGFLGFSQGAILSAALPGLQSQGLALTKVPRVKFLVIIGGAKFLAESWAKKAYGSPIELPSLHFLGKDDFLRPHGIELIKSCVDPVVVHHPKGHTVPRLDDESLPVVEGFLDRIQKILAEDVAPEQEDAYASQ